MAKSNLVNHCNFTEDQYEGVNWGAGGVSFCIKAYPAVPSMIYPPNGASFVTHSTSFTETFRFASAQSIFILCKRKLSQLEGNN